MSFIITHLMGDMDRDPPLKKLEDLFAELELADEEHTDVSVTHENGWSLGAFPGGRLIWEDLEADGPTGHMTDLSKEKVLELWAKLTRGEIEAINSEPWLPGYY